MPPNPPPPDTPEEDLAWMTPRRMGQPAKTGQQPIRLTGAVERLPRTYIYCMQPRPGDVFRPFAQRAQAEGWQYLEIDASHNPHITAPERSPRCCDAIAVQSAGRSHVQTREVPGRSPQATDGIRASRAA